jgi:hypothetical protein
MKGATYYGKADGTHIRVSTKKPSESRIKKLMKKSGKKCNIKAVPPKI